MGRKYSFANAKNCDINFKDSRMNHKKLTLKSERTHMQQNELNSGFQTILYSSFKGNNIITLLITKLQEICK